MSWACANRAVLGVLAYTGARVGAVARLRLGDLRNFGEQRALRFREKGGILASVAPEFNDDYKTNAWIQFSLKFLTIVVGFRTQASPVMFISDCRSTMPMELQMNM